MATTPNQEAVDTFISITGVPAAVARQKLQEHEGDLNAAVNAYFSEGDNNNPRGTIVPVPEEDIMDIDDPVEVEAPTSIAPEARTMNTFSPLDPGFGRRIFDSAFDFTTREPFVTHPRQVREIPIEVKDGNHPPAQSGHAPTIVDVTETIQEHGPHSRAPVIVDEVDKEPDSHAGQQLDRSYNEDVRPSAPMYDNLSDYSNDIEEEMIRAAIEASKQDAQESSDPLPRHNSSHMEDAQLAEAVSLSLKTAEQGKPICEEGSISGAPDSGASAADVLQMGKLPASNGRLDAGSFPDEFEDLDEQPLVRTGSRSMPSGSMESATEAATVEANPPSSPEQQLVGNRPLHNGNAFPSDEWGGISSEEHDEAVMLEAAMFGGIPESGYRIPYAPHQFMRPESSYPQRIHRPPSPGLAAQRLIREQQDDEYLASLQADREKELKAIEEAEARRLEEEAARSAAIEEQRLREEEAQRKLEEKKELERQLVTKEASLPPEPAADDENAMTLLVRMPDGSRRGRRFLKSDMLQSLFDFIDVGRVVKPGSYRLVRPYPRRAFNNDESSLTLNELGLTSKQEALFLELI